MNLDHLPTMEQYRPKGFKDELRPITYQRVELMVPNWVNFITSDPNGDIHGHHKRPSVWCNSHWMSNASSISMCYLGYTPNRGNWKDTLLILKQKESEQKVEKEQKPQWDTKTVVTQEAMLTDEMFLAGVAFGMRLNKLLSKQGDSDVKEGS